MITTKIEAILFAAAKPITLEQLAKHLEHSRDVIEEAIRDIVVRYNRVDSGIHVIEHEESVQFVSNPHMAPTVSLFLKKETITPLTRPSLETLTIIAYRGPITKPEIEMIRGVNCSLILRNLLMRGYILEESDDTRLQMVYTVSHEFLQALGVHHIAELPDYAQFVNHPKINELLMMPSSQTQDV